MLANGTENSEVSVLPYAEMFLQNIAVHSRAAVI